jgi:DNA (cytosine-5)-methyltransferase 1
MKGGTLFSGVGAPECAMPAIDWRWGAEIDPFACAVHKARFPGVPNHGDVARLSADAIEPVDLIVFGSPCQSFSVAGKRLGLDDPRGNMALVGLRVVGRVRPRWVVWENVPGVLSSDEGRDFGTFLGLLGELGYGFAYRVLDAQHFGVPQRRRRVFVIGHLGDWRPAAAVLFESESLRGDTAPRRETGERVTPILEAGARTGVSTSDPRAGIGIGQPGDPMFTVQRGKQHAVAFSCKDYGADSGEIAPTLRAMEFGETWANGGGQVAVAFGGNRQSGPLDVATAVRAKGGSGHGDFESETFVASIAPPVTGNQYGDHESREGLLVTHSLRADGFDASEDGTGRGTPLTLAIRGRGDSHDLEWRDDGIANAILTPNGGRAGIGVGAVAVEGKHGRLDDGALARAANLPAGAVRQMRGDQGGGPPQERRLEGSAAREFGAPLPKLPHQGTSAEKGVPDMREAAERQRTVQQTLNPHEAVGRSESSEGKPEYATLTVRRLTPRECERLQGFPDDYTLVTYRGKPAADGPRYRAIGNSMAVPVIGWILGRIRAASGLAEDNPKLTNNKLANSAFAG